MGAWISSFTVGELTLTIRPGSVAQVQRHMLFAQTVSVALARSGKVLMRRDLAGPAAGGVVTCSVRGAQSVAIVSGYVGSTIWLLLRLAGAIQQSPSSVSPGN